MKITANDIYELMTSPAMEPAILSDEQTGEATVRSAMYARDFPERYTIYATKDAVIECDHNGEYGGEGEPTDEWCEAMADALNEYF
jgi:hypothetical protein